jgi:probable HAF family extracellular repeat protein
MDINKLGQVVDGSFALNLQHAFLWSAADGMQDLGDLPGGNLKVLGLVLMMLGR